MGIEKISIDRISEILESVIKSHAIFLNYSLFEKNQLISNPTKITQYDFVFINQLKNRRLFIRIEDYYKHQRLLIWLNNTSDLKYNKLDVEWYYFSELKLNNIKQKMFFSSKSETDLKEKIFNIFEYLIENSDKQLIEIINGEVWIDMPFDWFGYK